MQYDFSEMIDRRNTNSMKWDVEEHELPMWVADMDFKTAPEVTEALMEKVQKGVFGYTIVPEEWYAAISNWWKIRHQSVINKEWLIFCTGVVPAISSTVRKLTTPGEKILIQTPVYNIFFNSILNNGRVVVENPLRYDGGNYEMDFADLEEKLSDPQVTMMILCNPHNPVGKIWDKTTLAKVGELCRKYHVIVLADEIHCDLTEPGLEYTPFSAVSETCAQNSITCIAPTKAFNLAGLQTAAVAVPNPVLRHKVNRALNTDEVAEPNALAMEATIAAFEKGGGWLDALRAYIRDNKEFAAAYIRKHLPALFIPDSKATYLLWVDCCNITENTLELAHFIRENTGLYVSEGESYGASGRGFLRINLACPRQTLQDGLDRLKSGIQAYTARS